MKRPLTLALALALCIGSAVPALAAETEYVLVKETYSNSNGFLIETTAYEYDDAGNLTKKTYDNNRPSGGGTIITVYEYDNAGRLAKTEWTNPSNGYSETTVREYDGAGNLTKETVTTGSYVIKTTTYEYDGAGNLTKETYDSPGLSYTSTVYEYDGAGRRTKKTYDGMSYTSTVTYEYDGRGNLTKETFGDAVDSIVVAYEYDDADRLVKKTYDSPHAFYTVDYEYDDAGNLTKETDDTRGSSETSVYEYEYDGAGNLTKKTSNVAFNDSYITIYEYAALQSAPAVSVTVNGSAVAWTDAAPFIDENDRTMVPLRAVGDALGLDVDWDEAAREAVFTDGAKTIWFPIGSNIARTSDGKTVTMDTAAVIVNDRTYAPVRYLAEYFGHTVGWDTGTRTVIIQ